MLETRAGTILSLSTLHTRGIRRTRVNSKVVYSDLSYQSEGFVSGEIKSEASTTLYLMGKASLEPGSNDVSSQAYSE